MPKYSVTIDGQKRNFEGSNAFMDSLRLVNTMDKGKQGVATHHTVWVNESDGIVLTETYPGQYTGVPSA